jgi:hypothetical protein
MRMVERQWDECLHPTCLHSANVWPTQSVFVKTPPTDLAARPVSIATSARGSSCTSPWPLGFDVLGVEAASMCITRFPHATPPAYTYCSTPPDFREYIHRKLLHGFSEVQNTLRSSRRLHFGLCTSAVSSSHYGGHSQHRGHLDAIPGSMENRSGLYRRSKGRTSRVPGS